MSRQWKQFLLGGIIVGLVGLFLFFRFYNITESLLFFNDIGRDFLVLFRWNETGKPPLLGPQTSALPFNQSAVYFYYLYPFYLLTGHSPYATLIANAGWYLAWLAAGVWWLRDKPKQLQILLASFFLITIHPEQIIQSRFVWNPSLVSPLLIAAVFLFWELLDKFSWRVVAAWAGVLALATAFTYSVVPVLLAFMLVVPFVFKKKSIGIYLISGAALAVVNLPTLAFELRHSFLLTNMMLHGDKLPQDPATYTLLAKWSSFQRYVLHIQSWWKIVLLSIGIVSGVVVAWTQQSVARNKLNWLYIIFAVTLLILLSAPNAIHAHYVFGIVAVLFMIIASTAPAIRYVLLVLCAIWWLTPQMINSYFMPAHRTVAETQQCAQQVCAQWQQPLVVSVQSGLHPYHNGMEFQYLLGEAGCIVKAIPEQLSEVQHMVVFAEQSRYVHGETAYHELTQFGESQEVDAHQCLDSLTAHLLEKSAPSQ